MSQYDIEEDEEVTPVFANAANPAVNITLTIIMVILCAGLFVSVMGVLITSHIITGPTWLVNL